MPGGAGCLPDAGAICAAARRSAGPERLFAARVSQDAPRTPTPPDKDWRKIQRLPQGVFIVVGNTYGPALTCRFAAATDDTLFCDAPESPGGTGWQFDRAAVISVEATILRKNRHPGLMAAMIAGGMIVGIAATRNMGAGGAAAAGAIGAAVVGAAGAPVAFSQPDEDWVTVVYRPRVSRQVAAAKGH